MSMFSEFRVTGGVINIKVNRCKCGNVEKTLKVIEKDNETITRVGVCDCDGDNKKYASSINNDKTTNGTMDTIESEVCSGDFYIGTSDLVGSDTITTGTLHAEDYNETYIPESDTPPTRIPKSLLWWNTSEKTPRLYRWDDKDDKWVALTPTEEEFRHILDNHSHQKGKELIDNCTTIRYPESKVTQRANISTEGVKIDSDNIKLTTSGTVWTNSIGEDIEEISSRIDKIEDFVTKLEDKIESIESCVDDLHFECQDVKGGDRDTKKLAKELYKAIRVADFKRGLSL